MTTLNFKILPARRKSNGKLGIYLAVTHRKQVRYISTEFEINDEAEFENGRVCYRKDAEKLNKRLAFVMSEYKEKLERLNPKSFQTCTLLKDALLKEEANPNSITISAMFHDRIERLRKDGREKYANMNELSCQTIVSILSDIPVIYISRNDIRILEREFSKRRLSSATMQIYLSHLKAGINELINTGTVQMENPFRGYVMPSSSARLIDVSKDEFTAILNLHSNLKSVSFAQDMWLLSFYLCGINMEDLKNTDLSGPVIRFERSKTRNKKKGNKETVFTIPAEARTIINKYINKEGKLELNKAYLLQYLNTALKRLANEACLNQEQFCFYSARKTFAQFAFELGVRTEVIEYCLGQSMKNNRPVYSYVRVMQKYADEAIRKVIDYAHGRICISNN